MKRIVQISCCALALTCATFASCTSSTPGRVVRIAWSVGSVAEPDRALGDFATDTGWHVVLDEAYASLGPFYTFEVDPLVRAFSVVSKALAHGGTDAFRRPALAEYLGTRAVNLLDANGTHLGEVSATAGHATTTAIFFEPTAEDAPSLHGHLAWVRGTASKDGVSVPFEGGLDIRDDGLSRRVDNVATDANLEDGGNLRVAVRVSSWFRHAHFDRLTTTDAEGRYLIENDSQPHTAWYLGARDPHTFATSWETRP